MTMDERTRLESFLRDGPGCSAAVVRKELLEGDVDVSLHARVGAAIKDTIDGETVVAAAVLPIEWDQPVQTFALGEAGAALQAAVGDAKPRKIVGKMPLGDGGGDLIAVSCIFAKEVCED